MTLTVLIAFSHQNSFQNRCVFVFVSVMWKKKKNFANSSEQANDIQIKMRCWYNRVSVCVVVIDKQYIQKKLAIPYILSTRLSLSRCRYLSFLFSTFNLMLFSFISISLSVFIRQFMWIISDYWQWILLISDFNKDTSL